MSFRSRVRSFLLAVLLLSAGPAVFAALPPDNGIPPFQAEYRISVGGIPAGKVEVSLELSGDGNYRYRQHSVPLGLLAVLKSDEITEVSEGLIRGDRVIPSSYLYQREQSKKPRKENLLFDWKTGRVTDRTSNAVWSVDIPEGTQDKFSKQLALMVAMSSDQNPVTFQVADDERLKTYHFRPQGTETIEIEKKRFDTLKIARSKGERPSKSTLWLAPRLHFLPVKVEKLERGNLFVMELVSVNWLQPDTALQR